SPFSPIGSSSSLWLPSDWFSSGLRVRLRSAGRLSWPDQEARQEGHCLRWGFTVRACTRGRRVWSDMNFPATLGAFVAPWKQVALYQRLTRSRGFSNSSRHPWNTSIPVVCSATGPACQRLETIHKRNSHAKAAHGPRHPGEKPAPGMVPPPTFPQSHREPPPAFFRGLRRTESDFRFSLSHPEKKGKILSKT